MSSNVASESQQATCMRTLRGGYPFTPEQGLELATALARMAKDVPPVNVNDFPAVLNMVWDLVSEIDLDLGFQRVWNKNVPKAGYVYFLATTRRRFVKLPQEEVDRARAERHYFDPSVQLDESAVDCEIIQIILEETGALALADRVFLR
ncbi:hypothetical protein ACG7TL_006702 [Trametes sanguinea]